MGLSRLSSLIIAILYLVITLIVSKSIGSVLGMGLMLFLPLALIWYSEELASFKGSFGIDSYINHNSPPRLVHYIGWIFLLLPAVIGIISLIRS